MQQPIRYYITKSGDEPTVRSVKVALGEREQLTRAEGVVPSSLDRTPVSEAQRAPRLGVKRLVRDAMRKRAAEA